MNNLFYSGFKKEKDLNFIANEILRNISDRWVITKDFFSDEKIYKPLRYNWYSIDHLKKLLQQCHVKDLKSAVNLLIANQHAEKLDADDWLQFRIAALESGEEAYRCKFYINRCKKIESKIWDNLKKRYNPILIVISFIIVSILGPLFVEWLKQIIW